jgi:hypothetical protein
MRVGPFDMQTVPSRRREAGVILLQDLAPRKDVRGGRAKRLFGERDDAAGRTGPVPTGWPRRPTPESSLARQTTLTLEEGMGAKKPSEAAKAKKIAPRKGVVRDLTARRDAAAAVRGGGRSLNHNETLLRD